MINKTNWADGKGWGWEDDVYGETFRRRAVGELPEMESSKATAKILAAWLQAHESIVDVGCGAGHYLRSLQQQIQTPFAYLGIDAAPTYLQIAKQVFAHQPNVAFACGDIFNLPLSSASHEIVFCCNVFLHLPSIATPMKELCRVAKRQVLVRTLVGSRSFRIQDSRIGGDEFDEEGFPKSFNYYNIYSRHYIEHLCSQIPRVTAVEISEDWDYDLERMRTNVAEQPNVYNATTVIGKWQVNGYILQPWAFIKLTLRD